jgi:serine/threonine/tyrosine-interacting protein
LVVGAGSEGEVDLSFMSELDLEDIVQKNTLIEWAYERRRQAQMILPWLYLGPFAAAKDRAFLEREGITMVLAVRAQDNSMTGALNFAREVCAEVRTVEIPNFHELVGRFAETTALINSHIARFRQHSLSTTGQPTLGKVMVFCESGNEKSAAVVAAYLMDMLNDFDFVKAMQVCQAQRFCVNFDDVLKNILRSYWDILQARRLVASSATSTQHFGHPGGLPNGPLLAPKNQKRTISNIRGSDDIDMDAEEPSDDALRFAGRDSTPFQNR